MVVGVAAFVAAGAWWWLGRDDQTAAERITAGGAKTASFEDVTDSAGAGDRRYGIGCACGDDDNDGDIDVVIVNSGAKVQLLSNVAGGRGNWIMFRLLDEHQRDAHGAMIRIEAGGGAVQWRLAAETNRYCPTNCERATDVPRRWAADTGAAALHDYSRYGCPLWYRARRARM